MAPLPSFKRITLIEKVVYLCVAIYAMWSIVHIITTSAPDFSVLYYSASHLRWGIPLYANVRLYTGLGYPGVSLLPFLPLTLLPYPFAQAIWVLGSCAAFLGTTYLSLVSIHRYTFRRWCALTALAFLAFPTKFTFGMGQANYYALFFLLLGVSDIPLFRVGKVGSLVLALLFKPHMLLVYVGLLATKKRSSVIWSLITVVCAAVTLGVATGWHNDVDYAGDVLPQLFRFSGREIYYNQSIGAGVARFLGTGGATIAQLLSVMVVGITFVRLWSVKNKTPMLVLALFLPAQLLVEPLAWQHHLVFLLPVMVYLWYSSKQISSHRGWIIVVAYVLVRWNIKNPVYWQGSSLAPIVLSHGLWGVLLVWGLSFGLL